MYGWVVPRAFHASQFLEQVLPGFRWLTPGSVLLGVVETFGYGVYAGFVFTLIHNTVLRRCQWPVGGGGPSPPGSESCSWV